MVIHPMIGISLIAELSEDMTQTEVKVGYVVPNSPAERSGILVGDIIVEINQQYIEKPSDVVDAITDNGIHSIAMILIKRRNELLNFKVQPIDIRDL